MYFAADAEFNHFSSSLDKENEATVTDNESQRAILAASVISHVNTFRPFPTTEQH